MHIRVFKLNAYNKYLGIAIKSVRTKSWLSSKLQFSSEMQHRFSSMWDQLAVVETHETLK